MPFYTFSGYLLLKTVITERYYSKLPFSFFGDIKGDCFHCAMVNWRTLP